MPKSKARKNVDENFKVAAVQRLQAGGVLANDLAKELGVSIWSLRKWSRRFWCKLLKGSVSCDNCRDDGTDLGTRSVQGTAL